MNPPTFTCGKLNSVRADTQPMNMPKKSSNTSLKKRPRSKLPFLLKLLIVEFLIISTLGWVRLYTVIGSWEILRSYSIENILPYIAIGGAAWGLIGLCTAIGLWFHREWAPTAARSAILFCSGYYWMDRLLLTKSPAHSSIPFAAVLNILVLIFTFVVLALPWQSGLFTSKSRGNSADKMA